MPSYDYSQSGSYVFTVVVKNRKPWLGLVNEHEFHASQAGTIVYENWTRLPRRFTSLLLDAFVVMPNHIHGIILLGAIPDPNTPVASPFTAAGHPPLAQPGQTSTVARLPASPSRDPAQPSLGEIIRSLKAASTTRIRKECLPEFGWQEGYWERIIRNEHELERFRIYIQNNPARWLEDKERPTD